MENTFKRTITTQQGLSQHKLELSEEDARIYTDLLTRNNKWWADTTNDSMLIKFDRNTWQTNKIKSKWNEQKKV